MGYIYKITNQLNGKIYIGKTQLSFPEERWKQHIHEYKKSRNDGRPLYMAMRKYGIQNFKFQIIEQDVTGQELCDKQKYYIDYYRSYIGFDDCNGYNATLGGDGKSYLEVSDQIIVDLHEKLGLIGWVAKELNIDAKTVRKVLARNGISYLTGQDSKDFKYYTNHGGVAKVDNLRDEIIAIYRSLNEAYKQNPSLIEQGIRGAAKNKNDNDHRSQGYRWYRLDELPDNIHL